VTRSFDADYNLCVFGKTIMTKFLAVGIHKFTILWLILPAGSRSIQWSGAKTAATGKQYADEKMGDRIGSGVASVLVILWMLLNSNNMTGPEQDLDSGPARSWPQIIRGWIFWIGELTIAVAVIAGAFYLYATWDNWRLRRAQRK
jgi:hypothetical protein